MTTLTKELFTFIENSPTAFQVVEQTAAILTEQGFLPLKEGEQWVLTPGQGYFVTRNGSSLIAFRYQEDYEGFMVGAAHTDSPCLHIKENPELSTEGYTRLDVEGYGGAILRSFMDRPLSVAGRVIAKIGGELRSVPVNVDRDLCCIPALAIHMDRGVNEGKKISVQTDMLPLLGQGKQELLKLVAPEAGVAAEDILGHDLYLYCRDKGRVYGGEEEFILCPRLDDLQCVFGLLQGFLAAKEPENIPVLCLFDNEEIGSQTRQGALSTFFADTLRRISDAKGTPEDYNRRLTKSFMVSADNAHGVHPNHPEKAALTHRPRMNGGVVVKFGRGYATTGLTAAVFRDLIGDVENQTYFNHSDTPGGSTLGNLACSLVAIPTVDIGLAQLSMHSANETGGAKDVGYLKDAMEKVFSGAYPAGLE